MPQPNYTWIYGSRYTPTAMIEFRQWLDQQSSMSAEERASRYAAQDRQNQEDAQREAEWTIRAFRNPY
jgi:hypothetical protein